MEIGTFVLVVSSSYPDLGSALAWIGEIVGRQTSRYNSARSVREGHANTLGAVTQHLMVAPVTGETEVVLVPAADCLQIPTPPDWAFYDGHPAMDKLLRAILAGANIHDHLAAAWAPRNMRGDSPPQE